MIELATDSSENPVGSIAKRRFSALSAGRSALLIARET